MLRLVQFRDAGGETRVAACGDEGAAPIVKGASTTYELAWAAIGAGISLAEQVERNGKGEAVDIDAALAAGRVGLPITHSDPAHLIVAGTGLTHLGSADGRDKMHKAAQAAEKPTDSMRMFLMGVEGGKPKSGQTGVQPEWFYKGDGSALVATGGELVSPSFAEDGGEEPELAGIYLIGPNGQPHRIGFCLANEFSDHVTEKQNYLWLAHSKLRQPSRGP